jgi:hypothetical protein
MTTHKIAGPAYTACWMPLHAVAWSNEPDCEYCLNGVENPQARDYDDYHRAQLAALARANRERDALGTSEEEARSRAPTRSLDVLESDLATLRAWAERLKYASRSQVADFKPEELREIADALGRAVK